MGNTRRSAVHSTHSENFLVDHLTAVLADLPDGALVIGYSGGLDSTVLLHALAGNAAARDRGLRALHVNHGLHVDSGTWAQHCRDCCARLGIAIDVIEVKVDPRDDGPEAAARRARWQAFEGHLDTHKNILALAHHRDDQAESVLLRLLRGAGPAGLTAMRSFLTRASGLRVWRPLLGFARAQITAYADVFGLTWLDDPSNLDTRYDRNFLRNKAMPLLRERWPELDAILVQVAQRQADAHALETWAGGMLLAHAAIPVESVLNLTLLRDVPRTTRWAALRLWLKRHGAADVGAARLQRIDSELIDANGDAEPRIDLGACVLRRYRDELHALSPGGDSTLAYRVAWDGRTPLHLPTGAGTLKIDPPAQALPLIVASRAGGERLRMYRDGPRRELKHLLQEAGVPPWQRSRWPVIWLDGEPAAFADIVIGAALREQLDAWGARLCFVPD